MNNLYFPNGCNICKSPVELLEEKRIYRCTECGASVTYHKLDTEFSKRYEPLGYLANHETNALRKKLKDIISDLWIHKRTLVDGNSIKFVSPINEIYSKYLVKVKYLGEDEFGISESVKGEYYNVFLIDFDKYAMFRRDEMMGVQNREKTYVWIAEELGLNAKDFKIGYLNKDQLTRAIEICHEKRREINARTVSDSKWYDQDKGSYSVDL